MEDIPPHTAEEARRTRAAAADHTAEEAASFKGRIASITKFYYGYSQKRLPVQPLCVIIFLMRTSVSVQQTQQMNF